MTSVRVEHDMLGDLEVPASAYYGVHTQRALTNFAISGVQIGEIPELVVALAAVKQACAAANRDLGVVAADTAAAIIVACEEIRRGGWHGQFVVDVIQGGAGTSTNMNANEVIANRALELLGHPRGDYATVHPIDHVNASQSTNDVYPTAIRLALYNALDSLRMTLNELRQALHDKAEELSDVIKMGRTQLQDAVPMTLGQEFMAYSVTLGEEDDRLREAAALLLEINLGATAIGTGINAPPGYAAASCAHLAEITDLPLVTAFHLVEATSDTGAFVHASSAVKRTAVKLSKICNDLRLLSSGPNAGLGEINLPMRQAGSSIMPGKVNPVIPEVVNQIAFQVIGNDVTITFAAEAGQLQLNAFEPVIVATLMQSARYLREGCRTLTTHCIRGITASEAHLEQQVLNSIGLITALTPHIGYELSAAVAAEARTSGRPIATLLAERGVMTPARVRALLSPDNLVAPHSVSTGAEPL